MEEKRDFHQPENQFLLPGMKHSLENTFPLYIKSASSGTKIKENGFHYQENVYLLILVSPIGF